MGFLLAYVASPPAPEMGGGEPMDRPANHRKQSKFAADLPSGRDAYKSVPERTPMPYRSLLASLFSLKHTGQQLSSAQLAPQVNMAAAFSAVKTLLACVVLLACAPAARADFAADRAECADRLMALATCLTYVQDKATARAPTPDCCAGLKQVVAASKKCMCVLVKDRDEPALGFKINVTRAMDLPAICNYPATFSDCPKILGMSPDAPEAAIFKEYARKHESKNGTTMPAAATGEAAGQSTSSAPTGGAGAVGQLGGGKLFFYLVSALLAFVSVLP